MNDEHNGGLIILGIDVQDFMRLKAARAQFTESGTQFICGQNGAGKSCLIEGLKGVFQGLAKGRTPQSSYSDAPIREGADKATIVATLQGSDGSKILVSCEYSDHEDNKKRRLKVTHEDGSPFPSARKMLGEVLDDIEFDLDKFANGRKPEDARYRRDEVMKSVPGLDEKLAELAEKRGAIFDSRTEVGRDVKRLRATFESMAEPENGLPHEEQSASHLSARLNAQNETLRKRLGLSEQVDNLQIDIEKHEREIEEHERRIAELKAMVENRQLAIVSVTQVLSSYPSVEEIEQQRSETIEGIDGLNETNKKIRAAQDYRKTKAELQIASATVDRLTEDLQRADETKHELLSSADFPIENLSVNEDDITFKSKPWSVAATSERYKVALATKIAQNPELRALFIDDGNKFDDNSLELIDTIAKENNIQVLMAYVVSDPEQAQARGGVYIEEGAVIK